MKHLFIINPASGGRKHRAEDTTELIRSVMGPGEDYEIYVTRGPMDACGRIRAEAGGPLRVYACGGDGTLNECVNGTVGRPGASVTHFPRGTGNDFIKMFGKENAARFSDLRALIDGETRRLDAIDCCGRYGVNICSVGIDARIGTDVHKYSAIPLIGGATGYVVSLAANLLHGINRPLAVKTPDWSREGEFALVCACNGRFYGGGFNPVPDASPDDGVIDFLAVGPVSRLQFLQFVGKYAAGRYRELGGLVTHLRGTEMEIDAEDELRVNIDGEVLRSRLVTFRMVPGAVDFILPRGMKWDAKTEKNGEK